MAWISYIVEVLKTMLVQAETLYSWLLKPIFTYNGTEYSALYITTPLVLIIILDYTILRWLLWLRVG